ncbi:MAG: hypothetical protein HY912_07835 [Desulfomonile tiedjei]|uniref:Uncharacterized protein n=1 Tax=Desulfomonile tiedjei TaxID=2358 RepID=A0A9D6Z313_9BACT|nr:hypothetical protein [Desulfomonile tiedjei]
MNPKKKKGRKERLEPLSFYGHHPKEVIRASMRVDPEKLRKLEEEEAKQERLARQNVPEPSK